MRLKEESRIDPMEPSELARIMETKIPRPRFGHRYRIGVQPGIYSLDDALTESYVPKLQSLDFRHDELVPIDDAARRAFRTEVDSFFESRGDMARMGFLHKSALALYGPPGSGKTTMLHEEADRGVGLGRITFFTNSPYTVKRSLPALRRMEPNRDVVIVMEDFDEILRYGGTQPLLEMLDGADSQEHVLFIASTNNLESLPGKLLRRGRIDKKIFVPNPARSARLAYLETTSNGRIEHRILERMADLTEGMNFGDLRDAVKRICAYGLSPRAAIQELHEDRKREEKDARRDQAAMEAMKCSPSDDCGEF